MPGKPDPGLFTPLTSKVKRKKFLVVDIESKDGDSQRAGFTRPFLVGVYDGKSYHQFSNQCDDGPWEENYFARGGCIDRAMRFMLQKKYAGHHIYAHNGGRFDFLFFLPWMVKHGPELGFHMNIIPVASSIQVLDVWRGKNKWRKWRFLDSFKLIPTSLDKAAKAFGLKGKKQHDLNIHESDPQWTEYLRQDCLELYGVLTRFHHYIETILGGEVGMTAPSTSIKLLRRRYLKEALPRSQDTHEFVRESYVGGRVEVFEREGEGLSYFDINSSYPAAMLEAMPAGKATWWEGEPPSWLTENQLGFCEVSVNVPKSIHIPPLPMRGSKDNGLPDGKLVFPTGKLRGRWEWDELKLALEVGCTIEAWHDSVWYEPVHMFEDFVRDLYKYRDKSRSEYDEGLAAVVKIMLNSAYGKFGMKTLRKKMYMWDDDDMPENATPADGTPDSLVWYAEEETDAPYIMPQIAARVTALGRIRLYRYMMQAQAAGGNVYYCDTDSIITDVREGIETTTELGGLKDEYPEQSGRLMGRFLGPKLYLLTDDPSLFPQKTSAEFWEECAHGEGSAGEGRDDFERVAAKGLQKRTREMFERFARGETIYMDRLEKVGTLARANFQRGPQVRTIPRTNLESTPGKRIMNKDGSTTPYHVEMWE